MANEFVIDFLQVGSTKSGDAIAIKTVVGGVSEVHIVDGGYQFTGEKICEHIEQHYGVTNKVNRVIVTHNDGDHAGGLRTILNKYDVDELWMLRPWEYADELIDGFKRWSNVDNLKKHLQDLYPNLHALEEIAIEKNIPIMTPFQGSKIGNFTVLWPSKKDYINLVANSDKTPDTYSESAMVGLEGFVGTVKKAVSKLIAAIWGDEAFPTSDTSEENNMSIIQYASIDDRRILLTGDAGRLALKGAAEYATSIFGGIPRITHFQVPHHGSRHNVDSETLDLWFGKKLNAPGEIKFSAVISASKEDEDHPRKVVIRAIKHRGGRVSTTEDADFAFAYNVTRKDWVTATDIPYPTEQESV
ncbi:ComEC/Rec2 family competence protein [Aeromonas enteropelogenes]|uniref:ComEC/Rec2 family competence protein n=1 Tax=Aeromonas enteropelogenes TaxID=29489 RepID=UPI003BA1C874